MWLIPSALSASAPAMAASISDSKPPASILALSPEQWPMSNGKPMQRRSFSKGWRTKPWLRRLFGAAILDDSTGWNFVAGLMPCLPASHASPIQRQASAPASQTNAGSGPQLRDLFASLERGLWCSKTCQDSFLPADSLPYSQTWPKWGSMRNGSCYLRPVWVPATSGSGFSSWPTVTVAAANGNAQTASMPSAGQTGGDTIAGVAQMWSTPVVPKGGGMHRGNERSTEALLPGQAVQWPTPAARDFRSESGGAATMNHFNRPAGPSLGAFVQHSNSPLVRLTIDGQESLSITSGSVPRLNPAFVFWLMGMPWWWGNPEQISFAQREMELFRCRLRQQLSSLCGGCSLDMKAAA